MKKVLLSLSMLAATVFAANAQGTGTQVPVYGGGIGNANDAVNSAAGFVSFKADATANPPTTVPSDWSNTEPTVSGNTYLELKGTGTYYVWGVSNGSYGADGKLQSFGYTGTAAGYVAFTAKAATANVYSKLKIGFIPFSDTTKTFATEIFEKNANAKPVSLQLNPGAWKTFNLPLSSFSLEDAAGNKLDAAGNVIPNAGNYGAADSAKFVIATAAQIHDFGQVNVILNVQSCMWNATTSSCDITPEPSDVSIDDIYITQNKLTTLPSIGTGTQAAAANIGSSVLFPNPTTGQVFANLTLQNAANVSTIVTDLMGKQISTTNFGTVSTLNGAVVFDASSLAKGMYTVTYVLDGTPAKAELVVVK